MLSRFISKNLSKEAEECCYEGRGSPEILSAYSQLY